MSSYVVLARKWRPTQFADIVGQGPAVRTLMNAIRMNRIHQAYLLTGSRGIGKTTIARLFAKTIRCENTSWAEVPGQESYLRNCEQCPSCLDMSSGSSVDVIEIDGASNNGVDAVREIRENAKYLPATGSRKIYIIDEVHMLTTAAFNALLKTLEEPPPHVIFMFATTEPHKIPATILSRCQRFDLRRVSLAQIQARLAEISQAEQIQAEPAALALIARAAEGSMRDALSLLDQVIAFSGSTISAQTARESVGLIEGQALLEILRGVLARKPLDALQVVEQAYQRGHDLKVLMRSLIEFLYGTILAKIGSPAPSGLELAQEEWTELKRIAELRPLEELELIFQALHQGVEWIARSPQPKIVLDVLLIKCAAAEALIQLEEIGAGNVERTTAAPKAPAPPSPVERKAIEPAAPVAMAAPTPAPSSPQPVVAQSAPAPVAGPKTWENFVAQVRVTRPLLASILEHGTEDCDPQDPDALIICFDETDGTYFREQLQAKVYSEQLALIANQFYGKPKRIRIELRGSVESMAAKKHKANAEREATARKNAQSHPIIAEAKALFGGELGPIELTEKDLSP